MKRLHHISLGLLLLISMSCAHGLALPLGEQAMPVMAEESSMQHLTNDGTEFNPETSYFPQRLVEEKENGRDGSDFPIEYGEAVPGEYSPQNSYASFQGRHY